MLERLYTNLLKILKDLQTFTFLFHRTSCSIQEIQSVYCHVHSEERQVSLDNETLSLLSTLNAKTSPNDVKIIKVQLCCMSRNRLRT